MPVTEIQKRAWYMTKEAIKHGRIVRPESCQECGDPGRVGVDGRALLQAHHHDYAKPLDVRFLCVKCHRRITRIPRGEENGNAAMTARLVRAAKLLHQCGFEFGEIADFYRVNRSSVARALKGRSWAHLERMLEQPIAAGDQD